MNVETMQQVAVPKLRVLFIVVITGLFLQFFFTLFIDEPYPAIKYPSFATIYDKQAFIEVVKPEITVHFGEGKSVIVNNKELFRNLPQSFVSAVFDTIKLNTNVQVKSRRLKIGAYMYEINKFPATSDAEYREFVEWMRQQAVEATKLEDPRSLTIDYYRYYVFTKERPVREERQLIYSVLLDFKQEGQP